MRRFALVALLLGVIAVSGRGVAAQDADPAATPEAAPACATVMHEMAGTPEAMEEELPEWQTIELTDARTGETYSIADLHGCVVYFETMATWCPNCKQQLGNVAAAYDQLDKDKVVFVAVSIETEISADDLAAYADENGFAFIFSVADADILKAISDEFGRESLVPPSTPHVVINPDGTFGDLKTGFSSADEIVAMVEAAMGDSGEDE